MSDAPIIVEVRDGVDSSVETKIKAIGTAAKAAETLVGRLEASLKKIDVSGLSQLQAQLNREKAATSAAALASEKLAAARLQTETASIKATTALAGATTAARKLAAADEALAAASARTAAANTASAAATARLQAQQDKAALSALRLSEARQSAADRAARALEREQAAAARAQKALDARGEQRMIEMRERLDAVLNRNSKSLDKNTLSQKQYNAAMRGVPAQITDIIVSLQGGQRPLTVLLQQGGQLKDMFGGVMPAIRALTAGLIAMINPFTVVAAAAAAFLVVVGMVESKQRTLNGLVAQFAATGRDIDGGRIVALRKELEQLPGVSRSAAMGVIQAFADVRNIGGENLKQAAKLSGDLATAMGTDVPTASKKLAAAMKDPLKGAEDLDRELGFLTVSQFKQIDAAVKAGNQYKAQKILIDALSGSIKGLTDEAATPLQKATTELGKAWYKFYEGLSNSSAVQVATKALIGLVNGLTWIIEKLDALASWKAPDWMQTAAKAAMFVPGNLTIGALSGGSPVEGNANVRTRTGPQYGQSTDAKLKAAGIKGDKGDGKAESRAAALAKLNAQLSNEIKLQGMIGTERDKANRFAAIEEQMIGRRIKLTKDEIATIQGKIDKIVEGTARQSEMDRIYSEQIGPIKQYAAAQQAANDLLASGAISQEQYTRESVKAFEAYSNFVAPLREVNIELDQQLRLSKTRGEQTAVEQQLQQVRNDLLTKGIELGADELQLLRERFIEIQKSNTAQQMENALLDASVLKRKAVIDQLTAIKNLRANPNSGFTQGDAATQATGMLGGMGVDTSNMQVGRDAMTQQYADFFAQLQQMRESDLLNEADYQNAKRQLAANQTSAELKGTKDFFGQLSGLQSSNVKELQRMGKAAAIVQATINTYEGATKALAQGGIYGAVMAAGVVAAGMAQVAQIKSQGFSEGGYTGGSSTTEERGVVHGREFVVNASATARNRGLLEAMNNGTITNGAAAMAGRAGNVGSSSAPIAGGGSDLNVTIENNAPGVVFETERLSESDVRVIARQVVQKESDKITAGNFNNPNSKTMKALQRQTNVQRNFK